MSMSFTKTDTLKALAIVHSFETATPFGICSALAVLNDGAGISYGMNQFTHRSGSLARVAKRYLALGGVVAADILKERLGLLERTSRDAIAAASNDRQLRQALIDAAGSPQMKRAQREIAEELYLRPAIRLCERLGFTEPLSLAVLYDSIVHGSLNRVARTVNVSAANEHEYITAYVRRRDAWLASFPRLARTRYRTKFFLNCIAVSNWDLRLPLNVNGVRLTNDIFAVITDEEAAAVPSIQPAEIRETSQQPHTNIPPNEQPQLSPTSIFAAAEQAFDSVDGIVTGVAYRAGRVKALRTTVAGTIWQTLWAAGSFFAGLPRAVWITVAAAAAILTALYVYRQFVSDKIKEQNQ